MVIESGCTSVARMQVLVLGYLKSRVTVPLA